MEIAPLFAAGIGAAGATAAGWIAGRISSRTNQRLEARRDRTRAYERASLLCFQLREFAVRTFPLFMPAGAPDPVMPEVGVQLEARALLDLHGTTAVRAQFEQFAMAMSEFTAEANTYARSDRNDFAALEGKRKLVYSTLDALMSAMRSDLTEDTEV